MIDKILTHLRPDLDSMMSVFLMKKFGEDKYPGVASADMIFSDADTLPDNKTSKELEKEGILALDIGGGKFDTHPVGNIANNKKRDRSATDLVAEYLGIIGYPELKLLIEYTRMQDTTGHSMFSKDYIHHLMSLHTILLGLSLLKDDSAILLSDGVRILENIPYYIQNKLTEIDEYNFLRQCLQRFVDSSKGLIDLSNAKYTNFNEWINRINKNSPNAFSMNEMDDAVSIKSIAIGAYYKFDKNFERAYPIFELCIYAILKRENEWFNAIGEFKNHAIIKKVEFLNIVGVESVNPLIIKVARFLIRSDILVYRNPVDGATTIFLQKNGPLNKFKLNKLAGLIRVIESRLNNENPNYRNILDVGNVSGWFLHQSECLLIKGSPKAAKFVPSKIPMNDLLELICYFLDKRKDKSSVQISHYFNYILEYENPIFRKTK